MDNPWNLTNLALILYLFLLICFVKRYLNEHIYGNADTDDLWDAMVKVITSLMLCIL